MLCLTFDMSIKQDQSTAKQKLLINNIRDQLYTRLNNKTQDKTYLAFVDSFELPLGFTVFCLPTVSVYNREIYLL